MTQIADIERKIGELELLAGVQKNLRLLSQSDEWKSLSAIVGKLVNGKVNDILSTSCAHEQVIALRAEINTYRAFLDIPKVSDATFRLTLNRIEDLRKRQARLHTLGIGSSEGRNEIKSIESDLAEVKQLLGSIP